ncbi:hypothetical protein RRG08_023495 [Elysia crispata]|uniref:Uncharacterized protein n=1 Tax=Elysia crispata TaxID=231223 RepID=A0AAE1D6R2_9GAST|nr:hypothetical protein RRG08_023495 [Elysia crispata]
MVLTKSMANPEGMKPISRSSDGGKSRVDTPDGSSLKMSQLTVVQDTAQQSGNHQASKSSFGFFSGTTSMFGSWLSKFTEGERANISSKDLNAFAPTSF